MHTPPPMATAPSMHTPPAMHPASEPAPVLERPMTPRPPAQPPVAAPPPTAPTAQSRKGGCARVFAIVWVVIVALTIIGAISGDDDEPVETPTLSPATERPVVGPGEVVSVGAYVVSVNGRFEQAVPELGGAGYLVADVAVDGSGDLAPLGPFGFRLVAPDGTDLGLPAVRTVTGRLVWPVGSTRGVFEIVWETPELDDDLGATWRIPIA